LKKSINLILGVVIVAMLGISIYSLIINLALKVKIASLERNNEGEFTHKTTQERERMRREFEERYREDLIVFEAKYKELEKEKTIRKDLEEKSQELEKNAQKNPKRR